MEITYENKDIIALLKQIKNDAGAYLAISNSAPKVSKLPWCSSDTYTEQFFNALTTYYENT